jgi:uncharacterized membrane protein YeaQ/YmgE (transglycosylase-associated protein family)
MHFIIWIIVSGIAGYIASRIINKTGSGLIKDVLLGIVGGFVGGFIIGHLPIVHRLQGHGGLGGLGIEIIVAILGAMLVIYLWNLLFRHRRAP